MGLNTIMAGIATYITANLNTYLAPGLPPVTKVIVDEEYNSAPSTIDCYLDFDSESFALANLDTYESTLTFKVSFLVGKTKSAITKCIEYREGLIKIIKADSTLGGLVMTADIVSSERFVSLDADGRSKDNAGLIVTLEAVFDC